MEHLQRIHLPEYDLKRNRILVAGAEEGGEDQHRIHLAEESERRMYFSLYTWTLMEEDDDED